MSRISFSESEIRRYYEARVPKLKASGKEFRAPCPLHKGSRDSFAINLESGQWCCHSECSRGGSIFQFEAEISGTDIKAAREEVLRIVGRTSSSNGTGRCIVATYDYTDSEGTLLFQCVRYDPKDFKQRRPDGCGNWAWNLEGVRLVLFNLPAVATSQIVFVVEGEKDVETLRTLGFVATCNPMGAGKWRAEYSETLRGKDVVIIPDNDDKGRAHAQAVANSLRGSAASVKVVTLQKGKDVSDWVSIGGTEEELVRLIEAVPPSERTQAEELARNRNQQSRAKKPKPEPPLILSCAELLKLETPSEEMLFEGYPIPARGLTLKVGAARSGKTILAVQEAIAVARGEALFDYYRVLDAGPVMIVEQDDPAGAASIKAIVERSAVSSEVPFYVVPRLPFGFGQSLLDWLEEQITKLSLRMVILDSYTALRGPRSGGMDIVKVEHVELTALDDLAKRLGRALQIIHHGSKGSAALDWTQSAAGTYVMAAATEAQVHLSRFAELDTAAPERLVRIRGRHSADVQMVLRFRKDKLDYEHVLEGSAAELYSTIIQIQAHMGIETFGAKDLSHTTGVSRATAHRQIDRLWQAGALQKRGRGEYVFAKF